MKPPKCNFSDTFFFSVSLAVRSLSTQSDLETMVKTLAPALLAELAKMKSSSSSSTAKKKCTAKPSKGKPSLKKKSEASSATKTKVGVCVPVYQEIWQPFYHLVNCLSPVIFKWMDE